jgi:enoyl-CoA hydratase/carnithine racemase
MDLDPRSFNPDHYRWEYEAGVATITLNRPEKKNPLTFESYAELRDTFRALAYARGSGDAQVADVKAVVLRGAGGDFSSGGDVHEIIGPLTRMDMPELLRFTRMTGDLVKAIRACPQVVIAAVEGVCVGAGAILAMASDLRIGTADAKVAFLFTRVGLAGCDMGACAILPRIVGHGRAAELLYTGRVMKGDEAYIWGFFNHLAEPDQLYPRAEEVARELAAGPTFAHAMTKTMLDHEWSMGIEQAIEAEAQAQAICMQTKDFERAYHAFAAKEQPVFEGN